MLEENTPAYRRPSFWVGIALIIFGLLLWAYPELLSLLVGAFFVGSGAVFVVRVLFPRRHWNAW